MLEPNYYPAFTVEGRSSKSQGARLVWRAEKMLELGATEALNLDGGSTTYLIFMGEILNLPQREQQGKLRRVGSLIGVGLARNPEDAPGE